MRNVVVICLDSVRKDYFDDCAPRIRDLAEISVSQCRAASSWTVPSHASMFTGGLPSAHGVHTGALDFSRLADGPTVLTDLSDHRSYCVSANPFLSTAFGADDMFDEVFSLYPGMAYPDGINLRHEFETDSDGIGKVRDFIWQSLGHEHTVQSLANGLYSKLDQLLKNRSVPNILDRGGRAVSRKIQTVVRDAEEPFFVFANYMDAHGGLWPHVYLDKDTHDVSNGWSSELLDTWELNTAEDLEPYWEDIQNYRDLYGSTITYLDTLVAETIREIQRVTNRESVVVITSDHGENLCYEADNYLFEHKASLTEGLLHVPLCVVGARLEDSGRYLSQTELRPLIADLATGHGDGEYFSERIGAELIGLGQSKPDVANPAYWHRMHRCAYQGDTKVVWDSLGAVEKYTLDPEKPCFQDGGQRLDSVPKWASDLFHQRIHSYKASVPDECGATLDQTMRSRLQDLGYL